MIVLFTLSMVCCILLGELLGEDGTTFCRLSTSLPLSVLTNLQSVLLHISLG